MSAIETVYFLTGGGVVLFFGLFVVASIREKRSRAAIFSLASMLVIGLLWFGVWVQLEMSAAAMAVPPMILAAVALLFFLPPGKTIPLVSDPDGSRVDERDIMFAREEYDAGSAKYETYYAMRPENKEVDDALRKLPVLLAPGGRYYDPIASENVNAIFRVIEDLGTAVDGDVDDDRREWDPSEAAGYVKNLTLRLGADEVGIARLNPAFIYSHVGRGPEPWGAPIENHHRFAIVFCLEMDYDFVETAPGLPITNESALQYLRGANISISLANHIRSLGYPARAHIAGSNYQIMLPPVAHDAGLGELGRIGYLISPRFGARVRLGAVTTDLPLTPDKPIAFGVQDFCEKCLKCAINCPSGAIPKGGKVSVRGTEKWPLNIEQCLHYWRAVGTDCGLCMRVCPYSHPPTLVHNIVRAGLKRSPLARTVSAWGDDLFYGRRINYER